MQFNGDEFLIALSNFRNAAYALQATWESVDEEGDMGILGYPFRSDFGVICAEIQKWEERQERELKLLKKFTKDLRRYTNAQSE